MGAELEKDGFSESDKTKSAADLSENASAVEISDPDADDVLEGSSDGNEEDVRNFKIDKIEIPEMFSMVGEDKQVFAMTGYISPSEAGRRLGMSRQTLGNYTRQFYEILNVWQDPSNGYYRYSPESLRQIAFLYNDRKNNNRSWKQEKEFILSSIGRKTYNLATDNTNTIEKMFQQMTEAVVEAQKRNVEEVIGRHTALLEDQSTSASENAKILSDVAQAQKLFTDSQDEANKAQMESINELKKAQEDSMKELKDMLSSQQNEEINRLRNEVEQSKKIADEKDKEIEALKEQLRLAEEEKSKRKKIFGIF